MNVSRETSMKNVQKQACAVKNDFVYSGRKYYINTPPNRQIYPFTALSTVLNIIKMLGGTFSARGIIKGHKRLSCFK